MVLACGKAGELVILAGEQIECFSLHKKVLQTVFYAGLTLSWLMPMNKKAGITIFLFLTLLFFPVASFQVESAPSEISFFDHFEGDAIDAAKWSAQENTQMSGAPAFGGSIDLFDSNIILSSNGSSFPFLKTISNAFPASGDFAVQLNVTYTCIADLGDGIMFGKGVPYMERPTTGNFSGPPPFFGYFGGDGTWVNRIFTLWAADRGTERGMIYIEMFNTLVWKTYVQGFKPSSAPHLYRLTYNSGIYTVYVDGEQVAQVESQDRPDTIVLGSAPLYYVPWSEGSYGWGWSTFQVDYIKVTPMNPSVLSVSAQSEISQLGYRVNINGKLTSSDGNAIASENIVISYSVPGTSTWNPIAAATTDDYGYFSVNWISPATGKFMVKATWPGNDFYAPNSDALNISILQDSGQNLFTAESNSTLSSLGFNATSKEIAFSVSGPTGSTGYVRFTVSKGLLGNQSDYKIYLDERQVNFTVSTMGDVFIFYFEYPHSSHLVTIALTDTAGSHSSISLDNPAYQKTQAPESTQVTPPFPTGSPSPGPVTDKSNRSFFAVAVIMIVALVVFAIGLRAIKQL